METEPTHSSEIVLHLRTIHFALVLISLLVGLSVYGYSSGEPTAVHKQFEYVSRIKTNWMIWTKRFGTEQIKWLQDQGLGWPEKMGGDIYIPPEELSGENLPQRDNGWTARPLYSPIYLHLSVGLASGSRHEILGSGWPREGEPEFIPGGYHAVGNPRLENMEEFRQFWNASNNVVAFVLKDISEVAYVVSNGEIRAELQWIAGPKLRQGTQLKLGRMNIGLMQSGGYCKNVKELLPAMWSPRFNVLFCGLVPPRPSEEPSQILVLPAKYKDKPISVNLRVWLADHFNFSSKGGSFEETFPDLYDFIKKNPQMQFNDIERLLQSDLQREKSSEKVEFLGLKFREGDLASRGTLIIVIIQIYLLLHLRELSTRLKDEDHSFKAAWIGIYPDLVARTVSLLTTSFLPIAVLVYGIVRLGFSWLVFTTLGLWTGVGGCDFHTLVGPAKTANLFSLPV